MKNEEPLGILLALSRDRRRDTRAEGELTDDVVEATFKRARRARDRRRRLPALVAIGAAVLLAGYAGWWRRGGAELAYVVESAPDEAAGRSALRFSDGTSISLAPRSRGRVSQVRTRGATVVLEAGKAHVSVKPQPHADWTIEAGPFTVLVKGTTFDVSWEARVFEISMEKGQVLVRGPKIPQPVSLTAGQRLAIDLARDNAVAAPEVPAPRPAPPTPAPPPVPVMKPAPVRRSDPPVPWTSLVSSGAFDAVVANAEARGIDSVLATVEGKELAALADAARYLRKHALSERVLRALQDRFPDMDEARGATFLLGRIAEAQGAAEEASRLYEAYLQREPSGPYRQEALGRRMVLVREHEGHAAAVPLARAYLDGHPDGTYVAFARQVLASEATP